MGLAPSAALAFAVFPLTWFPFRMDQLIVIAAGGTASGVGEPEPRAYAED